MKMKNFITLLVFFCFCTIQAQFRVNYDKKDKFTELDQQRFSWGYFIGLNHFNFNVHPVHQNQLNPTGVGINSYGKFNVYSDNKLGFSAGLMGRMKVSEYFDLFIQPGIHFTERILHFNHIEVGKTYNKPDPNNPYDPHFSSGTFTATEGSKTRAVKSTYLDLPLFIQLHGDRWFNTRPYVQAGFGYMANLQSNQNSQDDNEDGIFRLKSNNYNYQIETGISIYFNRFRLTPSVKGVFLLNNELIPDDIDTPQIWAGSVKSLKTRAILFSLKFE